MTTGFITDERYLVGHHERLRPIGYRSDVQPHAIPRFPAWVRVLDRIHGCAWSVEPILADAAVVAATCWLAGVDGHLAALASIVVAIALCSAGVYGQRTTLETQGLSWYVTTVARAYGAVSLLAAAVFVTAGPDGPPILAVAGTTAAALFGGRAIIWGVLSGVRHSGRGLRRTLVVGSGDSARTVVAKLRDYPEAGLIPVGIVSPDGASESGEGLGTGALPDDLPAIIRYRGITHVVLAPDGNQDARVAESIALCDGLDVSFSILPPLADLFLHPGLLSQVGGLPLIVVSKVSRTRSTLPTKRVLDLLVAGAVTLLALPIVLLAAAAVKLGDGGPVFYRQKRVGLGGREFWMLKLRSMQPDADRLVIDLREANCTDGLLFKVHNDPRVTPVGRWIRRLSIDELPQLWNVIRGDMSMVGPRPLPVDPSEFGALDGKRHKVRPGITGYWQIAGGTGLSYQEMVKLDLAYIQNWSLWLDLRLLCRTIPALASRHRHGAI